MMRPSVFKEYDIRGEFPKAFDTSFAFQLGQAFVSYLQTQHKVVEPSVSVGYDARLSSPDIAHHLMEGLQASGAIVYNLGMVTTPLSYYSTYVIPCMTGAVMVTGSHNPPQYNGFKLSSGHQTLFGPEIQKLRHIMEAREFPIAQKNKRKDFDILTPYIERYTEEFKDLQQIPVVMDCGNGAAGVVLPGLLRSIGFQGDLLYERPDGHFPHHHPDPSVEAYLKDLSERVRETHAYMGVGYDGDGDRMGVVDENGQMILGDDLMMIFSKEILKQHPGRLIIGDVKCSDRFYRSVEEHNGRSLMWKTGHSLIKQKMKQENAIFGGEMSGHLYFNDRNYGFDDAIYGTLRLIEILGQYQKPLSYFLKDSPRVFTIPELRIEMGEEQKRQILASVKKKYSLSGQQKVQINQIDGLRISYEDGWALLRGSNTQSCLVVRYESTSQAGFDRIQSEVQGIMDQYL